MQYTTKLFRGQKVRAAWDSTNRKWWLSVVDVCAVLRGCTYDRARNYWKQQKRRMILKNSPLTKKVHQIKMLAKDRKMRYGDVMDHRKVVQLIQQLPGEAAKPAKAWLGAIAAKHCDLLGQLDINGDCTLKGAAGLKTFRYRLLFAERPMPS